MARALLLRPVALPLLLVCLSPAAAVFSSERTGGIVGPRRGTLLQTWNQELQGGEGPLVDFKDSPVARVVKLLQEMQTTMQKEMEDDAALYEKLYCWCKTNLAEKEAAIEAAQAKISELEASIKSLTAKCSELKLSIKQLEDEIVESKQAVATATALREKEAKAYQAMATESIANIESIKAAVIVIERGMRGGASMAQILRAVTGADQQSPVAHLVEQFLSVGSNSDSPPQEKFLQQQDAGLALEATGWTTDDTAVVSKALKSAAAFMQAKGKDEEYYAPQSGQIVGILKQLKEEMESDLSDAKKAEDASKAEFEDMRKSKMAEIAAAEAQAEQKEDTLAAASMDLAEAKEDLGQTNAQLSEDQKFLLNAKKACQEGEEGFAARKKSRTAEIQAVSEAIEVLMDDESRITMSKTFSFVQLSVRHRRISGKQAKARKEAAALLRSKGPELSILATSVELDSFTRVKKAIDDMIAMLKVQQDDEVKKQDWCTKEIQSNEMATTKTEDKKADISSKIDDLVSKIARIQDEIEQANKAIAQAHTELQKATVDRQAQNMEFQRTVADQSATQEILKMALKKLAKFYDTQGGFVQTQTKSKSGAKDYSWRAYMKQPQQLEYKANEGAKGVISMLEKLILEAKDLENASIKGETEAQKQYEQLVADTNASVNGLMQEIATKSAAKAEAEKEKTGAEDDLADTEKELQDLSKYSSDLHGECDYLLKNFGMRQEARGQEIEALQQAKQILSGAAMG